MRTMLFNKKPKLSQYASAQMKLDVDEFHCEAVYIRHLCARERVHQQPDEASCFILHRHTLFVAFTYNVSLNYLNRKSGYIVCHGALLRAFPP